MNNKVLSDKDYLYVYSRTPRLCVDLFIKNKGGVLLAKRLIPPFKNFWSFPGGRVRHRESIASAITRVAKAELGSNVKVNKMLGYIEYPREGKFFHSVSLVFEVVLLAKIKGSEQADEIKFFKTLPKMVHPWERKFLLKYIK
ncbi:MAG: NUDIX domain-containing protein [Candidatus Komeilibacteria bacterium]|nr:NUDIX domain-containing protein [Candidatus Komeilibacteria bacterium]